MNCPSTDTLRNIAAGGSLFTDFIVLESVDSTNTYAKDLARHTNKGTIVVAKEQTAGRGRLGRTWKSDFAGALTFSLLFPAGFDLSFISPSLAAGEFVHKALFSFPEINSSDLLKIKWPNDLNAGDFKICGILAETTQAGDERRLIVGIGLNLAKFESDDDLLKRASSVEKEFGFLADIDSLFYALMREAEAVYSRKGFSEEYVNGFSYLNGLEVEYSQGRESDKLKARAVKINKDGSLKIALPSSKYEDILSVNSLNTD